LAPAWLQLGSYDRRTARAIRAQRHADATQGAQLDRLIAAIKRKGGGRVYAGMPSNWGAEFTVGAVPVFKYLESRDIDEVGYTLRTASLMTDPEYYFDERNPSDYRLFAIHYLILPAGSRPPVPARPDLRAGPYALWTLDPSGYIHAGTIVGTLPANRTNIGTRSIPILRSHLAEHSRYLRVAFDPIAGAVRPRPLPPARPPARGATEVSAETDHLDKGEVAATVTIRHAGVVVLSASFDPGWAATVDGRPQPTKMVAPALVATTIPAGTHRVVFSYHGFGFEGPLLFAGPALLFAPVGWLRRRRSRSPTQAK
ncbi:MAG: YfhO family protein, partial [Solirubrobacteraceae bacterium]